MRPRLAFVALALASFAGCTRPPPPAAPELRLRRVILYQNGIGYFERTGVLRQEVLRMRFREGEIDDVLKSIVVVEEGLGADDRPATVSARLAQKGSERAGSEPGVLDLVLSPRTDRSLSIAYAVPTATWKATYRVILPDPNAASSKGALLQAWALIDNVSDEDWTGVRLTLATGAPLSYASNLREAQFVSRPQATLPGNGPVATGPVLAERVGAADADRDGVADSQDACPTVAGGFSSDPKTNGCPPDKDRDGIVDARDACPDIPGVADADPVKSGCPKKAEIKGREISLNEMVQFDKDKATLRPESGRLLDEIASILRDHPEIQAVTLEGHVQRGERDPWGLAGRRAEAVRAALLARKVAPSRLSAKPFGDTRPIAENDNEEGRQKNRRTEIRIARLAGEEAKAAQREVPRGAEQPRGGVVDAEAMAKAAPQASPPSDVAGSVRYDVADAVSIPKHSSALVTILNAYVPGEDIYLFRPDPAVAESGRHPLRAARLENQKMLGLQPGSVAIFAGGTFVGEGLLGKINPGETTLIPYALDSSTEVTVSRDEEVQPVKLVAASRGVLTVEDAVLNMTHYRVGTGLLAPARMFVRHERRAGWEAEGLPPHTESSPAAHLVPLPLTPGQTSDLQVTERMPRRYPVRVDQLDAPRLLRYIEGSSKLPDEASSKLREAAKLRGEVQKHSDERKAIELRLEDGRQRLAELRESIRSVERTPSARELQQKLSDRIAEATAQQEALSKKLADKTVALTDAEVRLSALVRELTYEEPKP